MASPAKSAQSNFQNINFSIQFMSYTFLYFEIEITFFHWIQNILKKLRWELSRIENDKLLRLAE